MKLMLVRYKLYLQPPSDSTHGVHPCLWLMVGTINSSNGLSLSRSRACRRHKKQLPILGRELFMKKYFYITLFNVSVV